MGAYHAREGFDVVHEEEAGLPSVAHQHARASCGRPYGKLVDRMLKFLIG